MRFGEEVVRCEFVDGRWQLETASGHRDSADVVIARDRRAAPPERCRDIDGPRRRSTGAAFHSARWDHGVPLDGGRVGVDRHRIDRGADRRRRSSSASRNSSLFQRTAQWIMPQENPAYTDEEQARFAATPSVLRDAARRPVAARSPRSSPTRSSTPTRAQMQA